MIERVSKSIIDRLTHTPGDFDGAAKAVIEAMREPTEKMKDNAFNKDEGNNQLDYRHDATRYYEDVWNNMIDAALGDK